MTKTKKLYLFAATFLFLSVFFVGVGRVMAQNTYEECVQWCGNDDSGVCYNECADEFSATGGGYGTGNDYSSEVTTFDYNGCMNSYSDSTYCDCMQQYSDETYCFNASSGDEYSYTQELCVQYYGAGYVPNSNHTGCELSSVSSNSTCDPDPSCWWYNCCSSASTAAQTPEQIAAVKTASNAAASRATAATTIQNAAAQRVNTELAQQDLICRTDTKEACDEATKSLNEAKAAYDKATEDAQAAIAETDSFSNSNYGNSIGVNYGVNVGFGNVAGVGGGIAGCGIGFEKIGGVCFPTTTGLSSAPISTILSNLFLWLMGLFAIFSVLAFVISGIQYLLAAGDEGMAETAKKNATNAIIGIIVGLSGFIIIKAISVALSGQSYFF